MEKCVSQLARCGCWQAQKQKTKATHTVEITGKESKQLETHRKLENHRNTWSGRSLVFTCGMLMVDSCWFDKHFYPPLHIPCRGARVTFQSSIVSGHTAKMTASYEKALVAFSASRRPAELRKALSIWVRWSSFLCPVRRWVPRQTPRGPCPEW